MYFIWRRRNQPPEIRLHLGVIERMETNGVSPAGAGILLGRVQPPESGQVVWIDDFEPFGGSLLAPVDARVGLYRCRTGGDLRLDEEDSALISKWFTDPAMVYLLICARPGKPAQATFFVQEHGEIHGYRIEKKFPFQAAALRNRKGAEGARPSRRGLWLGAGAGVLAAVTGAGIWLGPMLRGTPAPPPVPVQEVPIPVAPPATPASRPSPIVPANADAASGPERRAVTARVRPSSTTIESRDRTARPTSPAHRPGRLRRLIAKIPGFHFLARSKSK